jgi:membrane protease YdiL (CAAX protease family)
VAGFGLFLVVSLAVALVFEAQSLAASAALYVVNFLCFAGVAYWLGARRQGRSLADFGLRPFDWRWIIPVLLLALAVLPLRLGAGAIAEWLVGSPQDTQPRLDLLVPPGPLGLSLAVTLLGAGLLAPIAEELYFRGLLHGWLAGRLSLWPRVLLSSALFGLAHFDSAGVAVASFIMGIVCALALERSRSLWLPIIVHAVNNSLAVLLIYAVIAAQRALGVSV